MGISVLLERYKQLKRPDETVRLVAQRAIQKECEILVPFEHITVQRGVVYVREHPTIRSEIAIHQKKILAEIKNELGKEAPTRIA